MTDTCLENEKELLAHVVAWLQDMGWEVYQEVASDFGVADIVAVNGPKLWIIEGKMSLGLPVMAQANHWKWYAHMRSVAVYCKDHIWPKRQSNSSYQANQLAKRCCEMLGIGVIEVRHNGFSIQVAEEVQPAIDRKLITRPDGSGGIRYELREEQKTVCAAGGNNGGYYTPYKETCRSILEYVQRNPGCTLKILLDNIQTHYSSRQSARITLPKRLRQNLIPGVTSDTSDGTLRIYPVEQASGEVTRC